MAAVTRSRAIGIIMKEPMVIPPTAGDVNQRRIDLMEKDSIVSNDQLKIKLETGGSFILFLCLIVLMECVIRSHK